VNEPDTGEANPAGAPLLGTSGPVVKSYSLTIVAAAEGLVIKALLAKAANANDLLIKRSRLIVYAKRQDDRGASAGL
jgi:hypothetical protein